MKVYRTDKNDKRKRRKDTGLERHDLYLATDLDADLIDYLEALPRRQANAEIRRLMRLAIALEAGHSKQVAPVRRAVTLVEQALQDDADDVDSAAGNFLNAFG